MSLAIIYYYAIKLLTVTKPIAIANYSDSINTKFSFLQDISGSKINI